MKTALMRLRNEKLLHHRAMMKLHDLPDGIVGREQIPGEHQLVAAFWQGWRGHVPAQGERATAKLPAQVALEYRAGVAAAIDGCLYLCILPQPETEHVRIDGPWILRLVEDRRRNLFDRARRVPAKPRHHAE